MTQQTYARGDVLVSTDWVAEHINDPTIRLAESNEDVLLYSTGHIPGAKNVPWARAAAILGSCSPIYLAIQNVRNYDGSWIEWGNSVGVPTER